MRYVLVALVALFLFHAPETRAQVMIAGGGSDTKVEIPAGLTPEMVEGMVARLDDGQIRALLLEELIRRADEQAAQNTGDTTLMSIENRLTEMGETISKRIARWNKALRNLGSRRDRIEARLAIAEKGVFGMLAAAFVLVAVGFFAATIIGRLTQRWRILLTDVQRAGYWDRVIRSLVLLVVEMLPVIGFVVATRLMAPLLSGPLGPLNGQVWIYYIGVAYSWAFIVLTRRGFSPDAPQIRVAPLHDDAAIGLHTLLRRAVMVGAAGWLGAGMFPNLGVGFPPAMILVALAGTVVAWMLLFALVRNISGIGQSVLAIDETRQPGVFLRIAATAIPAALGIYLFGAWLYWLAHWLERGQHRLDGPIGTLIVILLLPIADRLGQELTRSAIRMDSDGAVRFRRVLQGAWRSFIGFLAMIATAHFWNINLIGLAKGEGAPVWASAAFDIAMTLLIGYLLWRLIAAALHTEEFVSEASEDADPNNPNGASRLDTLTPLFRNLLLGFLAVVVTMIVLSALGVDVGPLIASAGIVGIAVGFGAQALVRDIFSGIFFLIDDAFRVGEYIELDGETRGEVEAISVRSLRLRNHRGPVITIPFGELKKITNHNRDWVIYKMPFRLEPDTDPQHVKKVVKRVGAEFMKHPDHGPKFIEPLKSQGVFSIDDDSALIMRVKFKCLPKAQFVLRREIYHRLRAEFEVEGIRFARRKVEVVGADGEGVDKKTAAAVEDAVVGGAETG